MRQKTTNITFAAMQHGKDIFHILSMSHISECPEKSQTTWRNTSFAMDLWFMIYAFAKTENFQQVSVAPCCVRIYELLG